MKVSESNGKFESRVGDVGRAVITFYHGLLFVGGRKSTFELTTSERWHFLDVNIIAILLKKKTPMTSRRKKKNS